MGKFGSFHEVAVYQVSQRDHVMKKCEREAKQKGTHLSKTDTRSLGERKQIGNDSMHTSIATTGQGDRGVPQV
jgi:hypothetical protein